MSDPSLPFDPDRDSFPKLEDLPKIPGAPPGAAWVWGSEDGLGRLNLLTPKRVKEAAKLIQTGEIVPVNLPLHIPDPPSFGREEFKHEYKELAEGISYDDLYHLNTQSGTQWDGFRHFSHIPSQTFYNGTKKEDIVGPNPTHKGGVHHWAQHGIAGRAVLIDFWSYAQENDIQYDPYSTYAISFESLNKCMKSQNISYQTIQPGTVLLVRSGFNAAYSAKSPSDRKRLALRSHDTESPLEFAGLENSKEMRDFLHNTWFAAVGGDAPSFEAWPAKMPNGGFKTHLESVAAAEKRGEVPMTLYLHESLLALWGCPIGEMLDLERLSEVCKREKRWEFFFSSQPANVEGGVGTHVNGMVIF